MMLYEILNFVIPNANIKESGLCLNAEILKLFCLLFFKL